MCGPLMGMQPDANERLAEAVEPGHEAQRDALLHASGFIGFARALGLLDEDDTNSAELEDWLGRFPAHLQKAAVSAAAAALADGVGVAVFYTLGDSYAVTLAQDDGTLEFTLVAPHRS
ncbi:MAG: hypothetical protein JWP02_3643 [Acidimicrobiales bacterium]|nr:hypothetical protein [Acidimicrobiales bacterium]